MHQSRSRRARRIRNGVPGAAGRYVEEAATKKMLNIFSTFLVAAPTGAFFSTERRDVSLDKGVYPLRGDHSYDSLQPLRATRRSCGTMCGDTPSRDTPSRGDTPSRDTPSRDPPSRANTQNAPSSPRRGRPRLPTPERHARIEASKRAWRQRNAEHLRAADRRRRATDEYRAKRKAAWRARHPRRERLSEEERREHKREAVRRCRARVRELRRSGRARSFAPAESSRSPSIPVDSGAVAPC
jgi:hypothetical protein